MPPTVFGILGIQDRDQTVDRLGERTIYEAITEQTEIHNEEVAEMTAMFIEETTTDHTETYKVPGGGMMQESDEITRPGAVKGGAEYSVAYDLRDARDQVAWDDVSIAYLTVRDLQRVMQTIYIRHANWVRYHIMTHLLREVNATFNDRTKGALTIRRLANNDGTIYPPTMAGGDGAQALHYITSGYAASAISDTNDPFATGRNLLETYFGPGNPIALINPDESPEVKLMADFVPYGDRFIRPAAADPELVGGPGATVPGMVIGRVSGVWVAEWRNMPSGYIYMQDLNQPGPLKKRVDMPTGIAGRGALALVATQDEFPLRESFWRDRHGYGVGNRLNGVAIELTIDATYDDPAAFA